ncbi:hypothetical protein [Haliangium sp.]|uniref:hypothetical protein n=1 Tax=Haliangium sp. TaxID=2663208 RepID=UPI003D13FCB7
MSEQLQRRIDLLEEEVATLKEAIQFLAVCKSTNRRFLFFDWIVKYNVLGERRIRLDQVLLTLADRLEGRSPPKRSAITGVPSELLYKEAAPTYAEAKLLLMQALGVETDNIVEQLIDAFAEQGIHTWLVSLRATEEASDPTSQ